MRAVDISTVHMTTAPGNAATAANTRFRLTRRGRIVLTTIAATPLVVAAIMLALNGGIAEATTPGAASSAVLHAELVSFRYVTVAPGQTLWNLAESIAPSADPRDVIVDIIDLNQLQGDSVQPGQRLTLPAGY